MRGFGIVVEAFRVERLLFKWSRFQCSEFGGYLKTRASKQC